MERIANVEGSDVQADFLNWQHQAHDASTESALSPQRAETREVSADVAVQLAFPLHWTDVEPPDLHETRLAAADAATTWHLLATAVDILGGRRPLFDLYSRLGDTVYAAMQTRSRTGTSVEPYARLHAIHAQHPAAGVIEACATVHGNRARALVARLERKRRGWLCTFLRLV